MGSKLRAVVQFGDLDVGDTVDFGPQAVVRVWRVATLSRIQPASPKSPALVSIHWRAPTPWHSVRAWSATYSEDETILRVPDLSPRKATQHA